MKALWVKVLLGSLFFSFSWFYVYASRSINTIWEAKLLPVNCYHILLLFKNKNMPSFSFYHGEGKGVIIIKSERIGRDLQDHLANALHNTGNSQTTFSYTLKWPLFHGCVMSFSVVLTIWNKSFIHLYFTFSVLGTQNSSCHSSVR